MKQEIVKIVNELKQCSFEEIALNLCGKTDKPYEIVLHETSMNIIDLLKAGLITKKKVNEKTFYCSLD